MATQIEEKEFESQFNIELETSLTGKTYPIGQFLENTTGYEAIVDIDDKLFWRRINYPKVRQGVQMTSIDGMNNIKANLFIQYKRSSRETSKRSLPYKHWKAPYYQYRIDQKQHKILSDFSRSNTQSLFVCYAAPVFHLRKDLIGYKQSSSIIKNSNIVSVHKLDNHKRYTFKTTKRGRAYSEPEDIETENFVESLNNVILKNDGISLFDNTTNLYNQISEIINDDKTLKSYFQSTVEMESKIRKYTIGEVDVTKEFTYLDLFQKVTNSKWMILK